MDETDAERRLIALLRIVERGPAPCGADLVDADDAALDIWCSPRSPGLEVR